MINTVNKTPSQPEIVRIQDLQSGDAFITADQSHLENPHVYILFDKAYGPAGPDDGIEGWCIALPWGVTNPMISSKPLNTLVRRIKLKTIEFELLP